MELAIYIGSLKWCELTVSWQISVKILCKFGQSCYFCYSWYIIRIKLFLPAWKHVVECDKHDVDQIESYKLCFPHFYIVSDPDPDPDSSQQPCGAARGIAEEFGDNFIWLSKCKCLFVAQKGPKLSFLFLNQCTFGKKVQRNVDSMKKKCLIFLLKLSPTFKVIDNNAPLQI